MNTLLVDLGGVLLNVDVSSALKRFSSKTGLEEKEVLGRIFSANRKNRYDAGEITSFQFYETILPEKQLSFSDFADIWCDIFTEKREVIDYILSFKNTWRITLASNTDPLHYEFVKRNFPWFSSIEHAGLSFQLKAVKPSLDFFTRLCQRLNVQYHEVLFIDDLKENVDAACNLGITAHVFHDLEDLKLFMSGTE